MSVSFAPRNQILTTGRLRVGFFQNMNQQAWEWHADPLAVSSRLSPQVWDEIAGGSVCHGYTNPLA